MNLSFFHRAAAVRGLATAILLPALATVAEAAQPTPWQMGLQPAATGTMEFLSWFNNFTLVIVALITLFVMALLAYCIIKFNRRANPVPSSTTHHTLVEVVWTVVPILILVVIAIPSFRLLYEQMEIPEADMTVKVTGYQWYWGYEYTDEAFGGLSFDSLLLPDDEAMAQKAAAHGLPAGEVPRLLAVDYDLVVPVDTVIRVQVTGADVIHSFAVPAFGFKMDAVPGRLNEIWFEAEREGMYYGQCSELCGKDHAYMPIGVRVVSKEQFDAFVSAAQEGDLDNAYTTLAQKIETDRKLAAVDRRR